MKTAPNGFGAISSKPTRCVGPVRPFELFRQWWLFYRFVFGLFLGPLAEELGWRGFLLSLLNNYSPLQASVILGLIGAAWYINVFFSPLPTFALFTASLVAGSIVMTVMLLHARGSEEAFSLRL